MTILNTVDTVLLTLRESRLHVALQRRTYGPWTGELALIGGEIHEDDDEDTQAAAARVLLTKAGLRSPYLEQLASFSGRKRDPRRWSLSVAYYALVPEELLEQAPEELHLFPVDTLTELPFDHIKIMRTAVERVRSKSTYSSLPAHLCGERFTLPYLQSVYEAVLGEPLNKKTFRNKVLDELKLVEPVPDAFETGKANRPAQLYQLRPEWKNVLATTDWAFNADKRKKDATQGRVASE